MKKINIRIKWGLGIGDWGLVDNFVYSSLDLILFPFLSESDLCYVINYIIIVLEDKKKKNNDENKEQEEDIGRLNINKYFVI